ncbi:MAG: hypothetical protein ACREOW_10535 [Thermodesulfobacteriota bacterium]
MNKRSLFGMSVVLAITGILALIADSVSGFTVRWPHFESVGIISADGSSVEVTYIYGCNPDQGTPFFNTTVTQESTLSLARIDDPTQGQCTGEIRTLAIDLTVEEGHPALEEGTALACFNGFIVRRITESGKLKGITTIDGYCQFITLVKE